MNTQFITASCGVLSFWERQSRDAFSVLNKASYLIRFFNAAVVDFIN